LVSSRFPTNDPSKSEATENKKMYNLQSGIRIFGYKTNSFIEDPRHRRLKTDKYAEVKLAQRAAEVSAAQR